MCRAILLALSAVCFVASGLEAGPLPAQIARARYVALGYDAGDSFLSEIQGLQNPDRILPADQVALQNLREQLEAWGQYVVVTRPDQAELLFAVRAGRRASMGGGVRVGSSDTGARTGGPTFRAEVSSPDSMLSIYDASSGGLGTPLWRQRQDAGRAFPGSLLNELKQQVEASPHKAEAKAEAKAKKP
jgi:hypothetical protein